MQAQFFDATPSKDANGQISWSLCQSGSACGSAGHYPPVVIGKGDPAAEVTISINDPNHLGVVYAQNPMWVQPGANNCPQQQMFNSSGQIPGVTRVSDTQIKFTDLNTKPVDLTYSLQFVGAPALDPDIKNGGTNLFDPTTLLIQGAVVAAVVSLVISAIVARIVAIRAIRKT